MSAGIREWPTELFHDARTIMRGSQTNFRAAFWAMLTAVALSLFLVLSDPYSVRQSLIAQAPLPSAHSKPSLAAEQAPPTSFQARDDSETRRLAASEATDDSARHQLMVEPSEESITQSSMAATWPVSSAQSNHLHADDGSTRPSSGSAMPIVAPGDLNGTRAPRQFVALPPPPELIDDETSSSVAEESSPGPDVSTMPDDAMNRQLVRLHAQQSEMLELQRASLDRLSRLADEFHDSSIRLEALLDQRQTAEFPPGPSF